MPTSVLGIAPLSVPHSNEDGTPSVTAVVRGPVSGRTVEVSASGPAEDRLVVRAPDGEVELAIRLTSEGPVLSVRGAQLELYASQTLRLSCDRLELESRSDARLDIGGDLRTIVGGARSETIMGRSETEAHAAALRARRGNVEIQANDDVRIDGERIWLNR